MSRPCSSCGANNQDNAHFCNQCGKALLISTTTTGMLSTHTLLREGRYLILKTIGQGGMGAVYQAQDRQLDNRIVAIKEMSQQGLNGRDLQDAIIAFTREAAILAHLQHPGIPHIYEQFEEKGRRYLIMELVDGETLEQRLASLPQGQRLPLAQILDIANQLCLILEYLHSQRPPVIFRDLKPDNIMLDRQGRVRLIDFGIARFFKPGQKKDTMALGSQGYAPPEQYHQATSPRSDIYSLGATLHYLLTGDDPALNPFFFRPFSVKQPALERIVLRMVSLDASQRPAHIQTVRRVLERVHAHEPQSSVPIAPSAGTAHQIAVLLSGSPQDYRLWKSVESQFRMLLNDFPPIRLAEYSLSHAYPNFAHLESADCILLMFSEDFLGAATYSANIARVLDLATHDTQGILGIHLRPCNLDRGILTRLKVVPGEPVEHSSLYAQEQRILEAAKAMRKLIVSRLVPGKKTGPMSLLHWLLWQLYGQGYVTCPYFIYNGYVLKHTRPSGLASILLDLIDVQQERLVGEYLIGPLQCKDLKNLLHVIAPSIKDPNAIQGQASKRSKTL